MLVGRGEECLRIDRLLDDARRGNGGALVVSGEPGIGKTSLLEHAAASAEDMCVVRARGVETEASVPFVGLVDLLTPLARLAPNLPGRQAEALRSALAIGPTQPVDRLAVLVGAFNLLCAAAEEQPVLALVDDAHWLDAASAEAIAFAGRRIAADRVALLIATRSKGHAELPSVSPQLLTADQARALLEDRGLAPDGLDEAVRDAAGNPLALLELASPDGGRFERGHSSLEEAYARMVEALPDSCREAILLLAASRSDRPVVIRRALAGAGLTDDAFAPAEHAGLVVLEPGRLGFRHPLIRSAVYASASGPDRRRAHDALASACVEPELEWERVAHRAAAATEPDEELAASVERLASDVRLRGGAIATVEWYQRAAALSGEPAGRLRRLLAAADAAQVSGEGQAAEAILGDIELEGPGPDDVARVELLRGRIEARSSSTRAASSRLLDAARSLEDADPHAAAGLYIESVDPAIRAGRPQDAFDAAERALELAPAGDPMGLLARIARAASLVFLGDAAAAEADIDAVAADVARTPSVRGRPPAPRLPGHDPGLRRTDRVGNRNAGRPDRRVRAVRPGGAHVPAHQPRLAPADDGRMAGRPGRRSASRPPRPSARPRERRVLGAQHPHVDRRRPGPARRGRARAPARALGPPRAAVPADVRPRLSRPPRPRGGRCRRGGR